MILVKVHDGGRIVAICDSDLIGKKFEEDLLQLDITERFYKGEKMDKDKILSLAADAQSLNIVGEESIKFAIENNLISEDHIIYIKGVPHAQMFEA